MRDIKEIRDEIKAICDKHPDIKTRLPALREAGYEDINYKYLRNRNIILGGYTYGLLITAELPRKRVYRIQVSYYDLKKGYEAAWCVNIPMEGVEYVPVEEPEPELPF